MQQIWKYISAIFIDAHRACQFQTRCDSKEMLVASSDENGSNQMGNQ